MHRIISDLTFSSRQRLRQTWPSQLLDIWSGTTCWQIPKCRPGPTWSFWESILPDWNAVRSCPLRNTLLIQLWCAMIYASTNGHMDTWTDHHQTTKKRESLFVLSSGWKMIHDFMRCNVEARIHPLGWSSWWQGLWTETQGLCFFRCGTENDSGCLQSKIFRYLVVYVFVLFCCYDFWQWVEDFCFITLDATWDGSADIAMRQEGTLTGEHLPNKAIQLFSISFDTSSETLLSCFPFFRFPFFHMIQLKMEKTMSKLRVIKSRIYISQILQELRPLRTSLKLGKECKGVMLPMEILTALR